MKIWDDFLLLLEKDFGKDTVDRWLRTLCLVNFDACNIYLETKDAFQALWFEEHIRKKTDKMLVNNNGRKIQVHIKSPKELLKKAKQAPIDNAYKLILENETLNQNFTFENFLVTKENRFPFQILTELCGYDLATNTTSKINPTLSYNPLFIYGAKGSGKTHLLHAVANRFYDTNHKICFLNAQCFTEHLVKAIKQSQMQQFRDLCRSQDALLIDNIEIFACKNATQEEFFHTFNHFHTLGKPIILTSSTPPKDLKEVEARLISRFEWGINLPIKLLPFESFPQLLQKKLKLFDLKLSIEIQEYLLHTFDSAASLSESIEAMHLKRCIEPSSFKQFNNLDYVTELLQPILKKSTRDKITTDKIITAVCKLFDQTKEDLLGKSQSKEHVVPRKIAMYLMKKRIFLSYVKIGKLFLRDHSTVMSSVASIEKELSTKNSKMSLQINELNKVLMQ